MEIGKEVQIPLSEEAECLHKHGFAKISAFSTQACDNNPAPKSFDSTFITTSTSECLHRQTPPARQRKDAALFLKSQGLNQIRKQALRKTSACRLMLPKGSTSSRLLTGIRPSFYLMQSNSYDFQALQLPHRLRPHHNRRQSRIPRPLLHPLSPHQLLQSASYSSRSDSSE